MADVSMATLHVYDVTNSTPSTNANILRINRITRDALGIGGIFHGAIEVYGEEWSFGYCEDGSGVFSCPPKQNPMYKYRESIPLGMTAFDQQKVRQILVALSKEWPGSSYDLLAKNCNHFCDEFSKRLGVGLIPAWVNRFANVGDSAADLAGATMLQLRQLRNDMSVAGRNAYRWMFGPPVTEGAASTSEEKKPTAAPQEQRPFSRGTSMSSKTGGEELTAVEKRKLNGAEASISPPLPVCPVPQNVHTLERVA
ncbi:hypothetical protein KFL_001870140 [Klebsormidium nitens]|uniref:PPPDE domain-containing protein n=1 Tax=Klebsormidium nitens TaxID=105231 RepID=A0A1Y1I1P6_KLENI|nr:hypothetical protein KFL_001870140 [Klebsormidium nitens]|eukprot:GAQ84393.1 hypothetical protein KFL_001870140 [Klebsormidium nitens]